MALAFISKPIEGLEPPLTLNLQATYTALLRELMPSSTAQKVFAFVRASSKVTGVLLVPYSDEGAVPSMHIPYGNLRAHPALKGFTGGIAVVNVGIPMAWRSGKSVPIGITLIHELGHAKQLMEKEQWYESKCAEATRSEDDLRTAANALPVPKELTKFTDKSKWKAARQGEMKTARTGAKLEIENDNIQRHEKPVITELGLPPLREAYD